MPDQRRNMDDSSTGIEFHRRELAKIQRITRRTKDLERKVSVLPAIVTALPASAANGQVIYFQSAAMATDGIVWTLRYNSASASAYKWECVGGSIWSKEVDTNESTTAIANTWGTLATSLAVTPPLSGDYYVEHGCMFYNGAAGGVSYHSYSVGGSTTNSTADAVLVQESSAVTTVTHGSRRRRKNSLAAGSAITEVVQSTGAAGSGVFRNRYLGIVPIRVG